MHQISFIIIAIIAATTVIADDDATVMQSFRQSLKPSPNGWSSDTSFCQWSGVKCSSDNRVTNINLSGQKLAGTLPDNLNSLTQLSTLYLQNNALSGSVPSLANLSSLTDVNLGSNNFSSVTPAAFSGLNSLQTLFLGDNTNLSPWTFPTELTQSSNLNTIDMNQAKINGTLPDIFGSFSSLNKLHLAYNNLSGGLPNSLAGSGIQSFWINNNLPGLTGSITVISNMTQLTQVWLHVNKFTGPIPDLSQCNSIKDLQLRDNQLTGLVPDSLVSMSSLQNVTLRNNQLQGPVPVFGKDVNYNSDDIIPNNNFCNNNASVPCDARVMDLLHIAGGFGYPSLFAKSWTGNDPCKGWMCVVCGGGKITKLNFAKQDLQGTISPAFANFTDLTALYLNGNNLTGSIPQNLATLSQLEILDISNNNLSGEVPKFSPNLKFITDGNVWLGKNPGGGPPGSAPGGSPAGSGKGASMKTFWIILIVFMVLGFVGLGFWVSWKLYKGRRFQKFARVGNPENGEGNVKLDLASVSNGYGGGASSELRSQSSGDHSDLHGFDGGSGGNATISIHVLRQVTNDFSDDNILGRGGFGIVYKGELPDGTKIAVKRMISVARGSKGLNEFQAEIGVLTKVRHRHLVALLGYCINGNERLLVYEHMPQGTLTQHLLECREHGYTPLTWKQRLIIALDVGRGVEYLHSLAQQSFIHRDLKPSNILLGDDMRAKVADFGLVKNAPDGNYSVETKLAGTFGYLAPEYAGIQSFWF